MSHTFSTGWALPVDHTALAAAVEANHLTRDIVTALRSFAQDSTPLISTLPPKLIEIVISKLRHKQTIICTQSWLEQLDVWDYERIILREKEDTIVEKLRLGISVADEDRAGLDEYKYFDQSNLLDFAREASIRFNSHIDQSR